MRLYQDAVRVEYRQGTLNSVIILLFICLFLHGSLFYIKSGSFVSTWVKYYCIYHREPKRMTMMLSDQKSGTKNVSSSFFSFSVTYRPSRTLSLSSMCNLWIGEWMLAQGTCLFLMLALTRL